MKSTGVVRRIDELGRIVVPKEIRNSLGIRNGENIEIFIEEDMILLKKYLKTKPLESTINLICGEVCKLFALKMVITDRDQIICSYADNIKKEESIIKDIIQLIDNRSSYISSVKESKTVTANVINAFYYIIPIIVDNDALGCIILIKDNAITDFEQKLCKLIANVINNKLEIA